MKSYLVWKDGRREETEFGGGRSIIYARTCNGGAVETTFDIANVDGDVVYLEGASRDISKEMVEAGERNRERTMEVFRRGLAADADSVPGEVFVAMKRRAKRAEYELLKLQWAGAAREYDEDFSVCPSCGADAPKTTHHPARRVDAYTRVDAHDVTTGGIHDGSCELAKTLRVAGVPDIQIGEEKC